MIDGRQADRKIRIRPCRPFLSLCLLRLRRRNRNVALAKNGVQLEAQPIARALAPSQPSGL
jgi:hypothetical protein